MPPKKNSIRNVLAALGLATVSATGQAACVGNTYIPPDAGALSDAGPGTDANVSVDAGTDAAIEDAGTDAATADAATAADAATDGG